MKQHLTDHLLHCVYNNIINITYKSNLTKYLTTYKIVNGCKLAGEYGAASVCVKPREVEIAVREPKGTDVPVSTVIGFSHGYSATETKVSESEAEV